MATGVFLFTDIEGSTRLWSECPALMPAALAQHDALLVRAVEAGRGTVFKHTGDGICATFPTVGEAIDAAVAGQRTLATAEWGPIGELRVRMAIHVGEAEPRAEDWFGPGLNRTARLMAVAHGGQVVLSSAATDLARDAPSPRFGVHDLGVHRLRDLASDEHVWQVLAPGLRRDFPPLRSLSGSRGNLPSQLTSFLGREHDVGLVASELLAHRLVTLLGPGGVGKTRLALQSAAAVAEKFPDGAWFVELAPLSDGSAVEHAVAATIGLAPRHGYTPTELVVQVLRDWQALLVLDNCEHVLPAVRPLVHQLLGAAEGVAVVATSREPLRVPGELVHAVAPLPVKSIAVDLFHERACAANPAYARDADDLAAVRSICRRLDGMPLAIELAAARMRSMTAAEVEARLDHRFRLLGKGGDVAGGRHASLQAALDWSFELLAHAERRFFARLSVFAGSFDIASAHAIAGDGGADEYATLDALDALVDKSLVMADQRGGRTRYMLLETMRQYGADHLPPYEAQQLRLTHARHYAAFAELAHAGMRGPDDLTWVALVEESLDDLRAAFQYAVETGDANLALHLVAGLAPFNTARRKPEIWTWARAAIDLPGADANAHIVGACLVLSHGGHALDDELAAERWATRAAEHHAALGLPPDPRIGINLLFGLHFQGRLDEATEAGREALQIARAAGANADYDRVEAMQLLTHLSTYRGAPDLDLTERCLSLARELGNTWMQARVCVTLGIALAGADQARARRMMEEAIELCRRPAYPYWAGSVLLTAASAYCDTDPAEGLRRLAQSLDEFRATGARRCARRSLRDFMGAFARLGRHEIVAIIDGASKPVSIRPQAITTARSSAIDALGERRYDDLKAVGAQLNDDELSDGVRREIDLALSGSSPGVATAVG